MTLKRRQFTKEFTLQVVREIEAGLALAQAARQYHLHPNVIRTWREHYARDAERAFAGNGHASTDDAKVAELERLIGQLTVEHALLQKVLRRLEAKEHQ